MAAHQNAFSQIILVFLAYSIMSVQGKAHLWMRFKKFDNPGGKGENGHCCDGRLILCPSKCDHRFVICLDQKYGRPDISSCPYGKVATKEIVDQDSIVFGDNIGDAPNPMVFDFDTWPGRVRIKIGVWDEDGNNNDDFVDFLKQDISTRPSVSMTKGQLQSYTLRERVTLSVDIMVFCGPNSYGSTCSTLCKAKSDGTAGYSCDENTGHKICEEGWAGENCDVSVDECLANRCQHKATCLDGHLEYRCACSAGYTGRYCETDIKECLSFPCQNGGTCEDLVNGFLCACGPKWTGTTCEMLNACWDVPCYHDGQCSNVGNKFVCECKQGFAGALCETDLNECISNPCQNGGTCTDLEGSYNCTCKQGWTGHDCNVDFDECSEEPCRHAKSCQNLIQGFSCVCLTGYTGDRCDMDVDECLDQPCANGGNCTNSVPGFWCACPQGYSGTNCWDDVDECLQNPCAGEARCINTQGTFYCQCPDDFTGALCETQIDHCTDQSCANNGTCVNRKKDFTCSCSVEWTGRFCEVYLSRCMGCPCKNGATCQDLGFRQPLMCTCAKGWNGSFCEQDVDECTENPCVNDATCVNSAGNFSCQCLQGWTGAFCEDDINECLFMVQQEEAMEAETERKEKNSNGPINASPPRQVSSRSLAHRPKTVSDDNLPCLNAGLCLNVDGSFMCQCLDGWGGSRCQKDIDECADNPCQNGGVCYNTLGNFTCTCSEAWSGKTCQDDVDECEASPCTKSQICVNTSGGFICQCPQGWQGDNCNQDIDECLGQVSVSCKINESCSEPLVFTCKNNATCQNTFGSYVCNCTDGWSGPNCDEDIDECLLPFIHPTSMATSVQPGCNNSVPCNSSAKCDDPTANAKCNATNPCNTSSQCAVDTPTEGNHSSSGLPCHNGAECQNTLGSFICNCLPSWQGKHCDEDVNECKSNANACPNGGRCTNFEGGYNCTCALPWTGSTCDGKSGSCDENPCMHNGTCIPVKLSLFGGVQCICPRGWEGPGCEQDFDECQLAPCINNSYCVNENGSFRCACLNGTGGITCSSDVALDKEVSLPLYLLGILRPEEEIQMKDGIRRFFKKYGNFRHDVTVRALVENYIIHRPRESTLTQLSITISVENVTLPKRLVIEILNRIPQNHLASFFPLPFYQDDWQLGKLPHHSKGFDLPWYVIMIGIFGLAGLAFLIVLVCRRKGNIKWPRRWSEASIMFVKNGVRNSALTDETTRVSQSTEDAMGGAMVDSAMQRPRSRHTLSLPTRQRGEVILPWLDEDGSRSYIMDGFFSGPRSGGTRRARSVSGPVFGEMISVINPDAIRRFSACTPRANSDLQGFDNSMYMMCSPSSQPRQSCMRHSEKFRGALPPIPTTSEDN